MAATARTGKLRRLIVFLCHSSGDKDAVRRLYRWLQDEGYEPWLDESSLIGGSEWKLAVESAIRSSDLVVVCLSADSVAKRGFVQKEIVYALDAVEYLPDPEEIFIVPVKLEPCEVPRRLARWQAIDLFNDLGCMRLIEALDKRARSCGAIVLPRLVRKWRDSDSYAEEELVLQRDISGRYSVAGHDSREVVLERILDDRYRVSGDQITGAGIFRWGTYLGVYRDLIGNTWGIMQGSLFRRGGIAVHAAATRGAVSWFNQQNDEIWSWKAPSPGELPNGLAVLTPAGHTDPAQHQPSSGEQFLINNDSENPVHVIRISEDILAVQTGYWRGIGLIHEAHYLGIYRYTSGVHSIDAAPRENARWVGVWGCHEGDVTADGVFAIHGRNVIGIAGEFDITWNPVSDLTGGL